MIEMDIIWNASWLRSVALLVESKVERREEEEKGCSTHFQKLRNLLSWPLDNGRSAPSLHLCLLLE